MKLLTLDFETHRIVNRPFYPPEPVGCAWHFSGRCAYMAWGHKSQNNTTKTKAKAKLKKMMREAEGILFHNAAFDISVGVKHLGWVWNAKLRAKTHDTLLLAFLHDPRDDSLSLKPMAEKYLNMPPEEQDELKEWIMHNVKGAHDHRGKSVKHPELFWAGCIAQAPGNLVGRYAKGDVIRTRRMFDFLYARGVGNYKMRVAYERELRCLPLFEGMSTRGIRVRRSKLDHDLKVQRQHLESNDKFIYKKLGKTFDINSTIQLADALDKAGAVDGWELTDKGNRSTSRANLMLHIKDDMLKYHIEMRSMRASKIDTFMLPWLEMSKHDRYIYPNFHQVRAANDWTRGVKGTRTGRPSSTNPNLLNVPRNTGISEIVNPRDYLGPDPLTVFNNRDYDQQELRILAYYERRDLFDAYRTYSDMDAHTYAQELIAKKTGQTYPRKFIKGTVFGILYGMGLAKLAATLKIDEELARQIRNTYYQSFPGVLELRDDIEATLRTNRFIRTWGGRVYFEEIAKDGRDMKYKMLNYLIQGSAADVTKQAMINVNEACKRSRLVLQIYDELLICSEKQFAKKEMQAMDEAMAAVDIDVPMLSSGKAGAKSWGELK